MKPTGSSLLLAFALAAPATADDLWIAEAVVREHAVVVDPADGSTIVAGAVSGAAGGCPSRSRALVTKVDAGGAELWRRVGTATADSLCGDGGESPLFDEHTTLSAEHVVSAIVHGLALDGASGLVAAAGEVLLAWESGEADRLVGARGSFVVLLDRDGRPVADAYLGTLPAGPPPAEIDCQALCRRGDDTRGEQLGARGVAVDAGGNVVLTGWHLPEYDGGAAPSRDLFVARYAPGLGLLDWLAVDGREGHDCGLGVAAGPDDAVYVTGYGGFGRDLLVAKYRADGTREALLYGVGDQDDEGRSVLVRPDGNVLVRGRLTEQCSLPGMTLGAAGKGQQDFSVLLSPDLEPLWGETTDPFGSEKSGKSLDVVKTTAYPADFSVVLGDVGTGGLDELSASDDYHLRAYAGGAGVVKILAYFAPMPEPILLTAVNVELAVERCYALTLEMHGYDSDDFVTVGERDVCPGDEPLLSFKVSPELSRELGVDGVPSIDPTDRLIVRFGLRYPGAEPKSGLAAKDSTAGLDAGVDQISVDVEY
jgi:hypothetical protein